MEKRGGIGGQDDNETATADTFAFSVYAVFYSLGRVYKTLLDPIGLTYSQYLVMRVLWNRDGLAVGEIGEALSLDSGTLTPLLKRLETAGRLTRTRSATDERQVVISLSNEGRALRSVEVDIQSEIALALGLTPRQILDLQRRLSALQARLNGRRDERS